MNQIQFYGQHFLLQAEEDTESFTGNNLLSSLSIAINMNCVSHATLATKLRRDFGITGMLLDWLKSYLSERRQFTVLNGTKSDMLPVSIGIPQGSVLGPTLFTVFTNDLPSSVQSGSLYMFADDTTVFCIGNSADMAITQLNKALQEVYIWCLDNQLTPHPGKNEAMLLSAGNPMGPIAPAFIIGLNVI